MLHVPTEPVLGNVPSWPAASTSGDAQAFPYVSTFYDPVSGGTTPEHTPHSCSRADFPYSDKGVNNPVVIHGGSVYCGMGRYVSVSGGLEVSSGSVFVTLDRLGTPNPQGALTREPGGQLSILLYTISDTHIEDYRVRLILPLYS